MFFPECASCQLIDRNVNHNCNENLEVELIELYTYRDEIKSEWIDNHRHLNVAFFVLAFDFAADAIYEEWRIDSAYQSGCSVFTLGMNVDQLKELSSGGNVEIGTQLLDWDYN